jgi:CRISPR-associated protein (TIGR02584 family)
MRVLLAVLGTSPATLTETVWSLCAERPPHPPDHVTVITTLEGRRCLETQLFAEGGWERLCGALERGGCRVKGRLRFGLAADHVRLLPSPDGTGDLADIASAAHSAAAADFIMRVVREHAANPEDEIVASIAGGRKTMGALLTSCMVLLGRRQDRLCHVLVSPPYDSPQLRPRFLFPERGRTHLDPATGRRLSSISARIELVDIPFVRARGWYEEKYRDAPPHYMTLVSRMQHIAPPAAVFPHVVLDIARGELRLDGTEVRLSPAEFALAIVLARRMKAGEPVRSWPDAASDLETLHVAGANPGSPWWLKEFASRRSFDAKQDIRKQANWLRAKLTRALGDAALAASLVPSPRRRPEYAYPPMRIEIRETPDVHGRLGTSATT